MWVHPRVIGPRDTIRLSQKGGFALNVTIHCKSHPNVTDFALGSYRICPRQHHGPRSEEHTSEPQSLMRTSYAVFCLKKKTIIIYSRPCSSSHYLPYHWLIANSLTYPLLHHTHRTLTLAYC